MKIFFFLLIFINEYLVKAFQVPVTSSFHRNGQVILGGLFPLHYESVRPDNYSLLSQPSPVECVRYNFLGFRWFQAMVFAVEEINNRSDFLPNIELGFQLFDTCNTNSRAVSQSIYLIENRKKASAINVSAVVGPTESTKSSITSNIFSVYDLPQISYASTSRILSRKDIYNSFFRTIPNDDVQTKAIVDLLLTYNWTWVGAIAGDDDYGRPAITKLKEMARASNICIEYTGYVSESLTTPELREMAEEIRDFNATVFVVFISAAHFENLAHQLSDLNVTGKVWIASEAWATSNTIRQVDAELFVGTLGIAVRGGPMPGFRNFLENVSPSSQPENPFLAEFLRRTFNCSCTGCSGYNSSYYDLPPCPTTLNYSMASLESLTYLNWVGTELEKSYNVYLAVYVVAHALQNIMNCIPGSGLLESGECPNIESLESWQLLAYMRHVNFTQPGQDLPDKTFFFDDSGDPLASYKLVNWQRNLDANGNQIDFVDVGYYSVMTSPRWSMVENVVFGNEEFQVAPKSVCTDVCPAGFYRVRLSSQCCFECLPCPINEISVRNNSPTCTSCSDIERSNSSRTGCIPKIREYVRWTDGFGITFTILVIIGLSLALFTAVVFYKHRSTPIVKATNVQLSFLLLFSIFCCFLTPLFYVAEPQDWNCQGRMVLFSLSFTISVAAILVKTLRVLNAFEATFPLHKKKKFDLLGSHVQLTVVLLITLIQAGLCVAWLVVDPSQKSLDPSSTSSDTLLVQCTNGNVTLLILVYAYICILALVAFVFAFRARKLPENFNEAKFITFSMLIFFIVWGSFVPAYLTTMGLLTTVVYCIALLASTFAFLACIFFPKLYVILITPERNTKQEVHLNTASHAIKKTMRAKGLRKSFHNHTSSLDHQFMADTDLMKGINFNSNNCKLSTSTEVKNRSKKRKEIKETELHSSETQIVDSNSEDVLISLPLKSKFTKHQMESGPVSRYNFNRFDNHQSSVAQ